MFQHTHLKFVRLQGRFEESKKERFEGEQRDFWLHTLKHFTVLDGGNNGLDRATFRKLCGELFGSLGGVDGVPWGGAASGDME